MNIAQNDENLLVLPIPAVGEIENFIAACLRMPVAVSRLEVLRQRDFSVVARVFFASDAKSLIYKKVIRPWHCEAEILRFVQDVKLPNAPLLLGTRSGAGSAEILQEDVGRESLKEVNSEQLAMLAGITLAQTHDAAMDIDKYPGVFPRLDTRERLLELFEFTAFKLRALFPDFDDTSLERLIETGNEVAEKFDGSECCLQHGDIYGENIMLTDGTTPVFIDWSYFAFIGPRIYDLATLTSDNFKNAALPRFKQALIDGYAFGSGLGTAEIEMLLPSAYRLSRLLFLQWLLTRVEMGITQTTVGHVRPLIDSVVGEIIT